MINGRILTRNCQVPAMIYHSPAIAARYNGATAPAHQGRYPPIGKGRLMSTTQSAELVQWFDTTESAGLEIPASIRNMAIMLDGRATLDASGANAATLSIMKAILEAEDEDAIFAAANAGTTSSKNFIGVPFALNGDPSVSIEYKKSGAMIREQGGFPFYALIKMFTMLPGSQTTMPLARQ